MRLVLRKKKRGGGTARDRSGENATLIFLSPPRLWQLTTPTSATRSSPRKSTRLTINAIVALREVCLYVRFSVEKLVRNLRGSKGILDPPSKTSSSRETRRESDNSLGVPEDLSLNGPWKSGKSDPDKSCSAAEELRVRVSGWLSLSPRGHCEKRSDSLRAPRAIFTVARFNFSL